MQAPHNSPAGVVVQYQAPVYGWTHTKQSDKELKRRSAARNGSYNTATTYVVSAGRADATTQTYPAKQHGQKCGGTHTAEEGTYHRLQVEPE
jgi:hypothetical protein